MSIMFLFIFVKIVYKTYCKKEDNVLKDIFGQELLSLEDFY